MSRDLPRLLAVLVAAILGSWALAQPCTYEAEPNDAPPEANPIGADGCLTGELAGQDQDAFVWEVSEEDALRSWRIEIEGIPGQLTKLDVLDVEYTDDGTGVTGYDTLYTWGTDDGSRTTSPPFVVSPGTYVVGVSKGGGEGSYVAHFRPEAELDQGRSPFRGREHEGSHALYGTLDGDATWTWSVSGDDAASRWEVRLQGPIDRTLELELRGPDGSVIADGRTTDAGLLVLSSLGLDAGEHAIEVRGGGEGAPFAVDAVPRGRVTDGNEIEPNDAWSDANLIRLDTPLEGGANGSERDHYYLEIDARTAGRAYDLHVQADGRVDVTVYDRESREVQSRRGNEGVLRGLVFEEGRYGIRISASDVLYTLAFEPAGTPEAGHEREPNDELVAATALGEDRTARGVLHAQDSDVFRFDVEGEPQIWRIQAIGPSLRGIRTFDGGGSSRASLDGEGRLRLDNLALSPGRHFVRLEGEGEYALRAIALGPAPEPPEPEPATAEEPLRPAAAPAPATGSTDEATNPDDPEALRAAADPGPPPPPGQLESEPNDDETRSELLAPGATRVGVLSSERDADVYRFFLPGDAYVRIEAQPAADGTVAFDTTRAPRAMHGAPGEPAVLQRRLLAGDYTVRLWAPTPSEGHYQLRFTHLDPLDPPVDAEPNDVVAEALPLPKGGIVEGHVGEMRDDDFIALPTVTVPTELRVEAEMEAASLALYSDARLGRLEDGRYGATLPAGEPAHLRVRGRGDYRLAVTFDPPVDEERLAPLPGGARLALSLGEDHRTVAAYWHEGQAIEGELTIENLADALADVRLEAVASDAAFRIELPDGVQVPPGETTTVPYRVLAPDDVRDDGVVRVSFAARDAVGVVTRGLTLAARCEAPPVDPYRYWAVPDALAGHLDVAWSPLGATVVDPDGNLDVYVNDGWTSPGRGSYRDVGDAITIRLPGNDPHRLTGTLLHPQSRNVERQLRTFEMATSLDGTSFTTVLEGELGAARIEQAFPFDEPVAARFVRLRFLDDHARGRGAWIGEWKVLAEEAQGLPEFDLADPALGGVQVWSDPLLPVNAVLAGEPRRPTLDGRSFETATWVVGFHHGRAAQIARLEWIESERATPEGLFERATVHASMAGPVGPWTEIAEWTLERDAQGRAVLAFDEPIWARYLRFDADGHDPEERTVYVPEEVRVLERTTGDGYRSALAEWGHYRPVGPYEATLPPIDSPTGGDEEEPSDDARERARVVGSDGSTSGTVSVAEDEDWLRVVVPEGENVLEVRLAGDPTIGYLYELTDAEGTPLVHDVREDGEAVVLTAFTEPGDHYLHLWEPKRSVVFSWDTSGSVGPFQDVTYASVSRFGRDVDPDREFVQMLAFDDPRPVWLMPFWSGEPERVTRALNDFDRTKAASSSAETAMLEAVRGLRDREGTRAVLFITDHESGAYRDSVELWRLIEETRPRLFTFEISTGGSGITQDRMQAYAAANGGHYDYARNVGDFDMGFARASCHLRRPKAYEVRAVTRRQEPPGPGTLRVVRGGEADLPAVEVIFDASGSMGVPMPDGVPRIEAGKRVLRSLVDEILPEGTPFALRAFGHVTPSSCESRLDVPLAPLDRAAARAGIDAIEPKLLSQTAIAASLERVPEDLGEGDAARVVIVITDGEESCGGDPEAVVRDLQARGYDVQLAIVSLALSEEAAKERFAALAEVAGGTYADVADGAALRASVEAALYPTFEVLDPAGEVVARGRVEAEGVEVPMGVYSVRVPGHPLVREVRVPGDGAVDVRVGGD